jgi:hypothetical protein
MAEKSIEDIQMDTSNLYREEAITDLKAGSLRKMVPITAEGADDPSRDPMFTAVTQVMTPSGVLPLNGQVEGAKTLPEALAGFSATIQKAVEKLKEEMAAMQREQASKIIVPGGESPKGDLLI